MCHGSQKSFVFEACDNEWKKGRYKIKIKNREASTFFSKHALSTPSTTRATNGRIQGVLREKRAKGQMQEEEAPHNVGILKGLYCLPTTISVPATCWALQDSPTNPEDLGNVAAVQLSPPRGSRYSLGQTV